MLPGGGSDRLCETLLSLSSTSIAITISAVKRSPNLFHRLTMLQFDVIYGDDCSVDYTIRVRITYTANHGDQVAWLNIDMHDVTPVHH